LGPHRYIVQILSLKLHNFKNIFLKIKHGVYYEFYTVEGMSNLMAVARYV